MLGYKIPWNFKPHNSEASLGQPEMFIPGLSSNNNLCVISQTALMTVPFQVIVLAHGELRAPLC